MDFTGNDYYNIGLRLKFPDLINFFATSKCVHKLSNDDGFWYAYLEHQFRINKTFFNPDSNILKLAKMIYFFLLFAHHDKSYITHVTLQKFVSLLHELQYHFLCDVKRDSVDYRSKPPSHPLLGSVFDYFTLLANIDEHDAKMNFDEHVYGPKDPRMLLYPTVTIGESRFKESVSTFDASKIQFNRYTKFHISDFNDYTTTQLEFIKLVDSYVHRVTPYFSLDGMITISFDCDALEYILYSGRFKFTDPDAKLYNLINHVNDMYMCEFKILLMRKFY